MLFKVISRQQSTMLTRQLLHFSDPVLQTWLCQLFQEAQVLKSLMDSRAQAVIEV